MKQQNLNPEIEEKLLNLQRIQEKQMKGDHQSTSSALLNNHHEYSTPVKGNTSRKRPSSRTGEEDDEWLTETPRRRPPRAYSFSEKKQLTTPTKDAAKIEDDVNQIIKAVEQETKASAEEKATSADMKTKSAERPLSNRQIAAFKREQKKKIEIKRKVRSVLCCVHLYI